MQASTGAGKTPCENCRGARNYARYAPGGHRVTVLLLVATCVATSFAIRVLQRLPRMVFVATVIGSAVLILLLFTAADEPVELIGRSLLLGLPERIFLLPAVGIAAALACFGPLAFEQTGDSPRTAISNSQGSYFFVSLAPLMVALSVDSFPVAAFSWAIGLILLVLMGQPRREGRAGGAAQFLLLTVIASCSLLLSNHFIDLYPLTPENLGLAQTAFLFLTLGLGLLLAVAPLHIWLGPLSDEMPLLGTAFLVGVAQPVGLWLLFELMSQNLWLAEKSPLLGALILGGMVTIPVGALLALAEKRQGRFIAYLSLISLGHALIGFGLGTRLGLAGALLAILNRAAGVTLMAGGMVFVDYHEERRWQAVGAVSILLGGWALAGLAPMAGFASGWSIYEQLGAVYPLAVALLFASDAVALFSVLRWVGPIFSRSLAAVESTGELKLVPYLCTVVVIALLCAVVIAGISPQSLADPLLATLGRAEYLK